jgi:AcrR family transcriptional regulator
MAYHQTEKVLAQLSARRQTIIAASIDVIKKHGMAGFKLRAIADRGGFAIGLLYNEFPDMVELEAAVFAYLLERDLTEIRLAASREKNPVQGFAAALAVLYTRLENVRLAHAVIGSPIYRSGVRQELERWLKPVAINLSAKERAMAAAGALGALYGMNDVGGTAKNGATTACLFALRGIGLSEAHARRAVAA